MQFKKLLLTILFLLTYTFANLNTGLQKGQKILFVRLDKYASMTNFQGVNWIANKLNTHHIVTQKNYIPADLSAYDQVWDVRFDFHQRYLTNAEIGYLQNFMKNDSGSVFLLGENNQFKEVNNSLITFVKSVTKKEGFAISGIGYVGNSGNGWKNTFTVDTAACDSAENFDTDHQSGWPKVWTEVPGMVKKSEMAGGFSVLQYGSQWAGAVAWTTDKLKNEYPGKLVVFFDSQALHCNANTQWGLSWNHKNNLKFFWNISDFLSRTIPQATLSANPAGGIFSSYSINVTLTSDADSIIYSLNGGDTLAYDGTPVYIAVDTTVLWAKALGSNVLSTDKSWTFIKDLPTGTITADPGTPDTITEFTTGIQAVTLTSGNADDSILYIVFHENGTSDMGIFIGSGVVTITGDDTITATVYGDNIDSYNETWYFNQVLPNATLSASPSSTSIYKYTTPSLQVSLSTENTNQIVYQIISETDTTKWDTTTGNTEIIQIEGDVTLNAFTFGINYTSANGAWSYKCERDPIDPIITVTPSDSEQFYFGYTLDTIKLNSNADSLKWILSNSIVDIQTVALKGNNSSLITEAIKSSDADTMYLTVYAFGEDYKPTIKIYKYVRQYLSSLTDNKYWGYKFTDTEQIDLELSDNNGTYNGFKIHYIVTNDSNDVIDTLDDFQNSSGINIDQTTYIKAFATADNAVKSTIFTGYYILVAESKAAWYKDENGNGMIDAATINLTKEVDILPDSITLFNPFDISNKKTLYADNMEINGTQLTVSITSEFSASKNISTYFEKGNFGNLYGSYYQESPFEIGDSVAPIIVQAICVPGAISKSNGEVKQAPYKLHITFSEDIDRQSLKDGMQFFKFLNFKEGFSYHFNLSIESLIGDSSIFIVDDRLGYYPVDGDSIKINADENISSFKGKVAQKAHGNRYCYLQVMPIEVVENLMVISPVNPQKELIDPNLGSEFEFGLPVIIDYLIPLPESTKEFLDAKVKIFDQVGNIVAQSNGRFESDNNIKVSLSKSGKTLLSIVWDGRNSKERFVSAGMYKIKISYLGSDGKTWKSCIKPIGIRN